MVLPAGGGAAARRLGERSPGSRMGQGRRTSPSALGENIDESSSDLGGGKTFRAEKKTKQNTKENSNIFDSSRLKKKKM